MSTLFGAVSMDDQHMCDVFVLMPFKDEFKDIYTNVIERICNEINLVVKLADDFYSNRQIINEIWSAINNCQIVIADCTERNPNVFYELGMAHALEKSTIIITKKKEDIPFDIQGIRYIEYDSTLPGANRLYDSLKSAIVKVLESKPNPSLPLLYKDSSRYRLSLLKDAHVLEEETKKAFQLHEYDWAILFAEAWTQVAPGSTRAYEDLGRALNRSDQPQKAIAAGEKLIELNKLNYLGYDILGEAYSKLGEWENARKWQKIALKYAPPSSRQFVLIDISKTYEALGLVDEAVATLEELIPLLDKNMKPYYEERLAHLKNIQGK